MKAAVERERAAWRRKLAQGRARFQEMLGVVASGQALEKLKVLVDVTESEWANPPAVVEAPDSLLNDRPEIVVLNQRTTALRRPKHRMSRLNSPLASAGFLPP